MLHWKHHFVSGKGDGPDTTRVKPSNWNEDHDATTTLTSGVVVGKQYGLSGALEELPAAYIVSSNTWSYGSHISTTLDVYCRNVGAGGNINATSGTVTAQQLTSNGNINAANSISAGNTVVASQITSTVNMNCAGIIFADQAAVLGGYGIQYYGGHKFRFDWNSIQVAVVIDAAVTQYLPYSDLGSGSVGVKAVGTYFSGGPVTGWSIYHVDPGNTYFIVTVDSISDARLKKDVAATDVDALAVVNALQVRKFTWLEGDTPEAIGLVAQEVQPHIPRMVHRAPPESAKEGVPGDLLHLDLKAAVPYLIRAVQQLTARVAELEAKQV